MSIKWKLILSNIAMILLPIILMFLVTVILFFTLIGPMIQPTMASMQYPLIEESIEKVETITPQIIETIQAELTNETTYALFKDDQLVAENSNRNSNLTQLVAEYGTAIPSRDLSREHIIIRNYSAEDGTVLTMAVQIEMQDIFSYNNENRSRIRSFIIIELISLVVILVGTIGGLMLLLSRGILRPLRELNQGTEEIKNGNLDFKLTPTKRDEFGQVIANFEQMRERLQDSVTKSLAEEQSRKQMLAHISHDLRTPITAIKGYSEVLLEGIVDDPDKRDQYLRTIHNRAQDMEVLTDDLLLFSKLDLGKEAMNLVTVNLFDYLTEFIDTIRSHYLELNMNLQLNKDSKHSAEVTIDKERFKRVLYNLLDNADKYRKPNQAIDVTLSIRLVEDNVQLWIADTGKGISGEAANHIFDNFYRVDESRTSSVQGSGLGLAITQQIIAYFSGTIQVTSVEGEGTTFIIVLPRKQG